MSGVTAQAGANLNALVRELDLIANNVANVSTVGFKRRVNSFSKVLEVQQKADEPVDEGENKVITAIDFSQGGLKNTERNLDFALYGKGFFVIETENGPVYTRNGMFSTNGKSQIVDGLGRLVAGKTGAMTIPGDYSVSQLYVSSDGAVSVDGLPVGEFKLVEFKEDDEAKLVPVGNNCFVISDDIKPEDAANVVVKQGYQETSNVQMVEELMDMIMVSRIYESNVKLINSQSEISGSLMSVAMG